LKKELSDISEQEINEFYKTISENVKEARSVVKMSQLDLSLKLGIKSVAFYSNCENLRYNKHFNLEHIYKISKALNVDICDLIKK
jgi:transcriptional regulator with XRE-family HTH domain